MQCSPVIIYDSLWGVEHWPYYISGQSAHHYLLG